ncbi:HAD hydrolase-like protein [Chitinimonas koreensis]|uniref:HAD hydrolase-like protein n=1 Tax=Chitinimonas koreensis TaxID=356302 RepID=UPI00146FA1E4|nr:HAD hydrolase-like protein [Chitinimonas koreensis]
MLQQLGCAAEEVLFVGDSVEADLGGPWSIGMQACLIKGHRGSRLEPLFRHLVWQYRQG